MTLLRSGRSRWRVPLVTVGAGAAPAALALALTAGRAPLRTLAGLFFLAALVPALQLVAGAFFGWPAALATGIAVAALTLWQTFTPPRPMVVQPTQWPAGFTAPDQSYQSTLRPPPGARAAAALQGGGRATLGVCLARGTGEDLEVLFGGRSLPVVRRPAPSSCWLEFAVSAGAVSQPPASLEVLVRPRDGVLPPETERSTLIGGYTRPREQGGRSGGAQFFDGRQWRTDDLSLLAEGAQRGRLFVELRVFGAEGRFVEVWY